MAGSARPKASLYTEGHLEGEIWAFPRANSTYEHWVIVTDVDGRGRVTELASFDPSDMERTKVTPGQILGLDDTHVPVKFFRDEELTMYLSRPENWGKGVLKHPGIPWSDVESIEAMHKRLSHLPVTHTPYALLSRNCQTLCMHVRYDRKIDDTSDTQAGIVKTKLAMGALVASTIAGTVVTAAGTVVALANVLAALDLAGGHGRSSSGASERTERRDTA
eukprot:Unigene5298_Nuclearia_a/m.16260 Unigene5298_Nuclearia_a/g.16260  ORF Unigene5298_Nuclearia_a/g.16260 Unigene5298_Nuclearia_a/m.16260 type:complete len:220 (-) Unigene5298_Nuclearia_a:14-673(-)